MPNLRAILAFYLGNRCGMMQSRCLAVAALHLAQHIDEISVR